MNKRLSMLTAFIGFALWSCDQGGTNSSSGRTLVLPPIAQGDTAVLVNGRPISKQSVEVLADEIAQRRGGESVPKEKIVDELIKREILRQSAETEHLIADASAAARVDNAMRMILSQIAAESLIKKLTPSEDEIRKEYDQRISAMKSSEYKARHILVEDEKTALEIIKRLNKGEKFDALAKKLSKDPGSKNNGGDLGWFSPDQMVPPFANAVIALKNGETTKAPVKTDFGWHVIERESSREQEPPSYESVKAQVLSYLQSEKLQKYLEDEKAKAKVETLIKFDDTASGRPGQPPAPMPPGQVPAPVSEDDESEPAEAGAVVDEDGDATDAEGPMEVEEETVIEEHVPPDEDVMDEEPAEEPEGSDR